MAKKELLKEGQTKNIDGTPQISRNEKQADQSMQKGSQLYDFFLSGLKDVLYAENKLEKHSISFRIFMVEVLYLSY